MDRLQALAYRFSVHGGIELQGIQKGTGYNAERKQRSRFEVGGRIAGFGKKRNDAAAQVDPLPFKQRFQSLW
jgi:hypothetical protein